MASKKPSLDNVGKKSPDGFVTFSQTTITNGSLEYQAIPFQLPSSRAPSSRLQSSSASAYSFSATKPPPLPPAQPQDIISPPLPNRTTSRSPGRSFTRCGPLLVPSASTQPQKKSPPTLDQDKKRAAAPASSVASKILPNPYKKSRSVAGDPSPSKAATATAPAANLSTRKEMFSRKKMISTHDITAVEDYKGDNSSLVENHFCFSPQMAMFALTQPVSTLELSPTHRAMNIAAAASSLSGMTHHQLGIVNIPTAEITVGSSAMTCQPVSGEDPLCQAIERIPVKLKTFHKCVHCKERQAVTSRPAKKGEANEGPGSHPFDTCGRCAKLLGGEWLKDAAGCFCGKEKHKGGYADCTTCRRNLPCKIDGCVSEGEVHANTQLCNMHHNQYRVSYDEKKKVSDCRRCGNPLHTNRRIGGAGGAVQNICSNSPCIDKCAYQDPETLEWCTEDRGACYGGDNKQRKTVVYCPAHNRQIKAAIRREYEQQKKSGTFVYKDWQPDEVSYLCELTSMKEHKKNGKVIWKVVAPKFQKRFEKITKYSKKTEKQMKQKYGRINFANKKKMNDKKQK